MTSVLLVGERKTELNIGLSETLGEAIGVKEETSDLLEELITLVSNLPALGLLQLTLGLRILEIKLSPTPKTLNQENSYKQTVKLPHAEEYLLNTNLNKL